MPFKMAPFVDDISEAYTCTLGTAKLVEAERKVRRRRRVDLSCKAKAKQSILYVCHIVSLRMRYIVM